MATDILPPSPAPAQPRVPGRARHLVAVRGRVRSRVGTVAVSRFPPRWIAAASHLANLMKRFTPCLLLVANPEVVNVQRQGTRAQRCDRQQVTFASVPVSSAANSGGLDSEDGDRQCEHAWGGGASAALRPSSVGAFLLPTFVHKFFWF